MGLPLQKADARRAAGWVLAGVGLLGALGWAGHAIQHRRSDAATASTAAATPAPRAPESAAGAIILAGDQQRAVGLKTERVATGPSYESVGAPGRIAPDEARYVYVTPRAAGVIRSVAAHIGQDVKAGDLLATIDSSEVAQARLDLVTRLQELEIARTRAEWQQAIYEATSEMIERLKAGDSPEQIHRRFEERSVGENREQLLTAYAQYRLAQATKKRHSELLADKAIALAQYQESLAEFEVAQATYQGLMDRMGFETRLANSRAHQDLRQAETAVQVARERLRVLGVRPDGTEPVVKQGKVVGVKPDGTLPEPAAETRQPEKPETILKPDTKAEVAVAPVGAHPSEAAETPESKPLSSYSIWAPFDGTILDRAMIVPGVSVDRAHQLFTLADLKTVWVEAHVHEGDFRILASSRDADVRFTSPAYPDQTFRGRVIYSGDMVDEKSRSVLLLARADNPDRLLKPGMFVEVKIIARSSRPAVLVPPSALLTDGDRSVVYVRTGPESFERREVVRGPRDGDKVAILRGLEPGQEVVVEGAYKIKAKAEREAVGAG